MSIVYRIDQQSGVTFVLWNGVITANEWLAHIHRLTSGSNWPPPRRLHLTDLHGSFLDVSIDEGVIANAAEFLGKYRNKLENMKVAVVNGEAYNRGLMFEHAMSPYGASVITFNSLDTACVWLGIDTNEASVKLHQLQVDSRAGYTS